MTPTPTLIQAISLAVARSITATASLPLMDIQQVLP